MLPRRLSAELASSTPGQENTRLDHRSTSSSLQRKPLIQGTNPQFANDSSSRKPIGFDIFANPRELSDRLAEVGYQCLPFLALQVSLLLSSRVDRVKALLLEGASGTGKSYFAKCLAQICSAELMCLSCYRGMQTQNLIESPSTLGMANAMVGKLQGSAEQLMNLGILSRAFLTSQTRPVILLVDELDKPESSIDTFFLGPIQDAKIWLESRPPIEANISNIIIIFTKNWNRVLDEALLRRVHPVRMTYLDSSLEREILSKYCNPQIVANLVAVADRMRNSDGSYAFERPPAPEELLAAGQYIIKLLEWGVNDFGMIGRNVWAILSKSEHDRAVLEHMMRFHPDFMDPLFPDAKNTPLAEIYARLGRVLVSGILEDPNAKKREAAWKNPTDY